MARNDIPDEQRLRRALHELAAQEIPADTDLWNAIHSRLTQGAKGAERRRLVSRAFVGVAAIALTALCAFGIAAHATVPTTITRLLQMDYRFERFDPASLGQPLDLVQTIDGVTVTMQWGCAYADGLMVAFMIQSPDGTRFEPHGDILTDAAGIELPWREGYGVEGTSVRIFDNVYRHAPRSGTLRVHLSLYARELVLPPAPSVLSSTEGGVMQTDLQPTPAGGMVGPFTFDLDLPVISLSK